MMGPRTESGTREDEQVASDEKIGDQAEAEAEPAEAAGDSGGNEANEQDTSDASRSSRGRATIALLVAAVLVAVSGGIAWWLTASSDDLALARDRDGALVQASQAIEVLNTLDYREVDEGIAAWQSVSTGTLGDQLAGVGDDERQLLAEQEKISTGSVIDAAVLEIDEDSATVLAAVEVTVVDDAAPDAEPEVKRNRFSADLVREDGAWKLQDLQQVAVSL